MNEGSDCYQAYDVMHVIAGSGDWGPEKGSHGGPT